ncbi:hypothetical protein NODU109028_16885 [Nocardioides dubius]|uniref:Uncharacterized protein n=2 Tax=Nocardioides dubius TaxID=317019 RepID=A0ABP4EEY9_9ACTN
MATSSTPAITSLGAVHHPNVTSALEAMFRAVAPYFMTESPWRVTTSSVSHLAEISMLEITNADGDQTVFSVWACTNRGCGVLTKPRLAAVPSPR